MFLVTTIIAFYFCNIFMNFNYPTSERAHEQSAAKRSAWAKWVVRANERSERPSGPFKSRLSHIETSPQLKSLPTSDHSQQAHNAWRVHKPKRYPVVKYHCNQQNLYRAQNTHFEKFWLAMSVSTQASRWFFSTGAKIYIKMMP